MRPITLLFAALCTTACLCTTAAAEKFNVTANGTQEVPPADPDGSCTGVLTIDKPTNTISWNFTYANIAAPSAMHIHTGAAGVNGGVLVGLGIGGTPGTLSGSVVTSAANINTILANPTGFYVNVHNAEFPGGAVRSQLAAVPAVTFPVTLTGANEFPGPGDTDGIALGILTVDPGTNSISWRFSHDKISAPAAMHIHSGAAGVAGPVFVNLGVATTCSAGTLVNTTTGLTNAVIDTILAAPKLHYMNIHTADFPAGAVRQQLIAPAPCTGDIDGSGAVDGADLGQLLGNWGPCPS